VGTRAGRFGRRKPGGQTEERGRLGRWLETLGSKTRRGKGYNKGGKERDIDKASKGVPEGREWFSSRGGRAGNGGSGGKGRAGERGEEKKKKKEGMACDKKYGGGVGGG